MPAPFFTLCPIVCLFILECVSQMSLPREMQSSFPRCRLPPPPAMALPPVAPMLGVVTSVCVLSLGGRAPYGAQREQDDSKTACLWEAGLAPMSYPSFQACVSELGHPTVNRPVSGGLGPSVVLQGLSGSRAYGLPIPVTWGMSKNPGAQVLPRIVWGLMGWGRDSISNLLRPLKIPGNRQHGEPLVWGPEVCGK